MLGKIKNYGFEVSETGSKNPFKTHKIIEKGKRIIKIVGRKTRTFLVSAVIASMLFIPVKKAYSQSFSLSRTETVKTKTIDFSIDTSNRFFSSSATLSYGKKLRLQKLEFLKKVVALPLKNYGKVVAIARYYRDLRIGNKGGPFGVLVFASKYGKIGTFYGIASHVSGKTIYPHGLFVKPSFLPVKLAVFDPVKNSYKPVIMIVSTDVKLYSIKIDGKQYGFLLNLEAGKNLPKGKTLFITTGIGLSF